MDCWEVWKIIDPRVAEIMREENLLCVFIGEGGQITDRDVKIHILKTPGNESIIPTVNPVLKSLKQGSYERRFFEEDHLFLDIVEQVHEDIKSTNILQNADQYHHFFTHLLTLDPAICIAGGAVFSAVTNRDFKEVDDFDLFLLRDSTFPNPKERIKNLLINLQKLYPIKQTAITENAITVQLQNGQIVQIILREYQHPVEVLIGFDVDCCCFGFAKLNNNLSYFTTDRGLHSLETSTNHLNTDRVSPSYDYRIFKYATRGFAFRVPGLLRTQYLESIPALLTVASDRYSGQYENSTEPDQPPIVNPNEKFLLLNNFCHLPRLILMENFQILANPLQRIASDKLSGPPPYQDYFKKSKGSKNLPDYAPHLGIHHQLRRFTRSDYAFQFNGDDNTVERIRHGINQRVNNIELIGGFDPKIFEGEMKIQINLKTTNPGEQGIMFTGSFRPLKVSFIRWTQSFFNQLFNDYRLVGIYDKAMQMVAGSLGLREKEDWEIIPFSDKKISPDVARMIDQLYGVADRDYYEREQINQFEEEEMTYDPMPYIYKMAWMRLNLDAFCKSGRFRNFEDIYPDYREKLERYVADKKSTFPFTQGYYSRRKFIVTVASFLQDLIPKYGEGRNPPYPSKLLPGYFSKYTEVHPFTTTIRQFEDPQDFQFFFRIKELDPTIYKLVSQGMNDNNFYFTIDLIQRLLTNKSEELGIFRIKGRFKTPSHYTNVFLPYNYSVKQRGDVIEKFQIIFRGEKYLLGSSNEGTLVGLTFLKSIGFLDFIKIST